MGRDARSFGSTNSPGDENLEREIQQVHFVVFIKTMLKNVIKTQTCNEQTYMNNIGYSLFS